MTEIGPNQLREVHEIPTPVSSRRALIPYATRNLEKTVRGLEHTPLPEGLFSAKEVEFDEGLDNDTLQEAA